MVTRNNILAISLWVGTIFFGCQEEDEANAVLDAAGTDMEAADLGVVEAGPPDARIDPLPPCEDGLINDFRWSGSGLVECVGTGIRKLEPASCDAPNRLDHTCEAVEGHEQACSTDADCTDGVAGWCRKANFGCTCAYGCNTDADCDMAQTCHCGRPRLVGEQEWEIYPASGCQEANCRSAEDCPSGQCDEARTTCGGYAGFRCRSAEDTCQSDADCPGIHDRCLWIEAEGHFGCELDGDCSSE